MVAADTRAELYTLPERTGPSPESPILWPEAFGCAFSSGRVVALGELEEEVLTPGGGGGVKRGSLTLAGSMVAYDYSEVGQSRSQFACSTSVEDVVVQNLRTGKRVHTLPSGTPTARRPSTGKCPPDVGIGPVESLVLESDGAVAWIAQDAVEELGSPYSYQVHAVDGSGSRVVAVGTDIEPRSLALAGSTLYWTQGGKPMSAPLN
jgi:hypothetical protein